MTEHRQQRLNRSFSGSDGNESACNAGDQGSIPGSGRPPGEGSGNPLQYSCLGNSMDGGAWWATVCGITKSQTQLSDCSHTENIEWVSNKTRDDWRGGVWDTPRFLEWVISCFHFHQGHRWKSALRKGIWEKGESWHFDFEEVEEELN